MKCGPERKTIRLPKDVYSGNNVFSVVMATADRYPWFGLYRKLADAAVQLLIDLALERDATLYAWCIMPDHVHLLLQDNDLVGFVRLFKGMLTTKSRALEPTRPLWQRSFYDHALRTEESLETVALYIWQNPVRAGIVEHASCYAWSGSLAWPGWKEFT
jgi:putative transposase